jgi:hypothetical protein
MSPMTQDIIPMTKQQAIDNLTAHGIFDFEAKEWCKVAYDLKEKDKPVRHHDISQYTAMEMVDANVKSGKNEWALPFNEFRGTKITGRLTVYTYVAHFVDIVSYCFDLERND